MKNVLGLMAKRDLGLDLVFVFSGKARQTSAHLDGQADNPHMS